MDERSERGSSGKVWPNWCHYHKGPSATAVMVDFIERASAAPVGLYACAPCREQRGLVPVGRCP
ncbi:hypothetical protein GPA10_18265 [Streptomyces sp. p1417]|uniref:Uncharacterized protein n=1 Tax=Streptomyces typhae TaxID=2681492 RepID=A0A6L6WYS3_9ACTN|nr:hypothetical protein [Streptomyces typhae]MVO86649.1 hypothetical protein [Streptomyces typhae]